MKLNSKEIMNMELRGILVGINLNNEIDFKESMEELRSLGEACNIETVGAITQNLKKVNPSWYIGKGKVEELRALVKERKGDIVIFNKELSASQIKNLEKLVETKVIDRTNLILKIFEERAKTREAKLQVEVVRLQYELPRLIGANEDLGRQGGGVGTNNKGEGETKLELDRRKIQGKINELNKELEELKQEREIQRNKRKDAQLPMAALVGYTNSGKSSIMNYMVKTYKKDDEKLVFEKDMLFATLETSVRSIKLPNNKSFLLSDTVGFVSNLPHNLVKAFRSTLEEVCEADILIHVVDISNPNYENQIKVTQETLKEIGADKIPVLYVLNKIDLLKAMPDNINGVLTSAKNGSGMKDLVNKLCDQLFCDYVDLKVCIPHKEGGLLAYINREVIILNAEYTEEGALLSIQCSKSKLKKFQEYLIA